MISNRKSSKLLDTVDSTWRSWGEINGSKHGKTKELTCVSWETHPTTIVLFCFETSTCNQLLFCFVLFWNNYCFVTGTTHPPSVHPYIPCWHIFLANFGVIPMAERGHRYHKRCFLEWCVSGGRSGRENMWRKTCENRKPWESHRKMVLEWDFMVF